MKVLVAPAGGGTEPDDFSFTVAGELVTIPVECDAPGCGCERSWVGATTRAGTTTALIDDLPITHGQYVQALTDSDTAAGGPPGRHGRTATEVTTLAEFLLSVAEVFDVGTTLERSGTTIEARS